MFSSALKSLSSNISANYSLSPTATSVVGPWKIYDAKKKSTGRAVSVFIFERKFLDFNGNAAGSRVSAATLKRAHDEVVDRLRKEAASLARLRHPSILELVEPVEETRNGGLMFATELVTASLAGLLEEKDDEEKAGGVGGRSSRFVVEDPDGGGRRRRELEIDELEIQKGLLQVGKGLEFLHESAGLVHANLTPDAIFVNAKSDWKLSGLGFATPPDHSSTSTVPTLQLSEALNYDARLPRSVQLNMDYSSPDLIMDNNISTSADMFSLGLIVIALYNSPHRTPLDTSFSVSTYKRILSSPSSTPTPTNNYLSSRPIPKAVVSTLLPRLITRRPAQRISAREFQEAQYFDSILVSTIGFLDTLPAKTQNEKAQFMRGLPRILSQFPKSVLEKKVLPALLEETKDVEILSLILQNIFKVVELVPNATRTFSEKVLPVLREVFSPTIKGRGKKKTDERERDTSKEGGLSVLLENMACVASSCNGKDFKDDILPIIFLGLESPTHSVQDASLHSLPHVLPVLDFTTIKNELFPIVAQVFSKTSSMAIKISGLEALSLLCGGGTAAQNAISSARTTSSSAALDKYTIQEKIVPLLKVIKTKEPAVMMAALDVFKQVGKIGDTDFLAMDVLPSLWHFSLGPLLDLEQFQAFMALIKSLSTRIEQEQTRKLQDLSSTGRGGNAAAHRLSKSGFAASNADETDFESLVTGRKPTNGGSQGLDDGWGAPVPEPTMPSPPLLATASNASFAWSTPSSVVDTSARATLSRMPPPPMMSRTVTPDIGMMSFAALTPSNAPSTTSNYAPQPSRMQLPVMTPASSWQTAPITQAPTLSIDWSQRAPPPASTYTMPQSFPALQPSPSPAMSPSINQGMNNIKYEGLNGLGSMKIAPPPAHSAGMARPASASGGLSFGQQVQKQGMEKYESLL